MRLVCIGGHSLSDRVDARLDARQVLAALHVVREVHHTCNEAPPMEPRRGGDLPSPTSLPVVRS